MATLDDVRRIVKSLPETFEKTSYGSAAWAAGPKAKAFAWERPLRKSDLAALGHAAPSGVILGIRTDGLEMKEALLAIDPTVFFTTPHFDGYPALLIPLTKITLTKLKVVLIDAWMVSASASAVAEFQVAMKRKKAAGAK